MTPVVALPVLVQVVTRAGARCECGGVCGRSHGKSGGRCDRGQLGGVGAQLYAAPGDPSVPVALAYRVPVAELAAWCGGCLDRARALARYTRPAPAVDTVPLFDLDTVGGPT